MKTMHKNTINILITTSRQTIRQLDIIMTAELMMRGAWILRAEISQRHITVVR